MYVDYNGYWLDSAVDFFIIFMLGTGEGIYFSEDSNIAKAFQNSSHMKDLIIEFIELYEETGKVYKESTTTFSGICELELWLGVRKCKYSIELKSKTTESEKIDNVARGYNVYIVTITIVDKYNFDTGKEKKDFFSFLNNFGYYLEDNNYGKKYQWKVKYTQEIRISIGGSVPNY